MAVFGLAAGCWDIRSVKGEGTRKGKRTRELEDSRAGGHEDKRARGQDDTRSRGPEGRHNHLVSSGPPVLLPSMVILF
jgi:hypothetical protein